MDSLTVIAEPNRRKMLQLVWTDELSAGQIAEHFDVTFGAVSQHLAVLREAGFVKMRKDGRSRLYRTDHDGLGPFREMLELMWTSKLDALAATIEEDLQ